MDAAFLQSLLPAEAGVRIVALDIDPTGVTVALATTAATASCPHCGTASAAVHARYRRTLHDRACLGRPVRLLVTARKFVCGRRECPRRVFCERLPGLTAAHARTTGELAIAHRHLGLALGGEAGARLAAELGLPTSQRWSNGQLEGQVGRLKAIKRSMYGRAGMKLLRARVRHKG